MNLLFSRHPGDLLTWGRSMLARRKPLSYPIAWITFDAIRRIHDLLPEAPHIFEYGAGNSTIYWQQQGATVYAVDNNQGWYDRLRQYIDGRSGVDDRIQLFFADQLDAYVNTITRPGRTHFDAVIVDGAHRRECIKAAIPFVRPGGILVVDNTDWHWFRELPPEGIPPSWQQQAFPGYAPMIGYRSETTVWQRPANH